MGVGAAAAAAFVALACAGKPPPNVTAPGVAPSQASRCTTAACADPFAAWIDTFPLERGGAIAIFRGGRAAARQLRENAHALGLTAIETRQGGEHFTTFIPGVACDEFGFIAAIAPAADRHPTTWCFRPFKPEQVEDFCARGRIPNARCKTYGR